MSLTKDQWYEVRHDPDREVVFYRGSDLKKAIEVATEDADRVLLDVEMGSDGILHGAVINPIQSPNRGV